MRNVWIGGLLVVVFAAWKVGSPFMFSDQFEVVVIEQAASRSCNEGLVRSIGRTRSEPPQSNIFGYCGAIMTDHGAFDLVESGSLLIGADKREAILDALQSNCTVTVQASGFGAKPSLGDAAITGTRWTVLATDSAPLCP